MPGRQIGVNGGQGRPGEARGDKGRPLEGINDLWGPTLDYCDWFLLVPLGAINIGARLLDPSTIVNQQSGHESELL